MENNIVIEPVTKNGQTLHIVRCQGCGVSGFSDLIAFVTRKKNFLEELLLESGAILFRDFGIGNNDEFLQIKQIFSGKGQFDYLDGNSPRKKLIADVYTSTEYPREYRISLHNEMSYSNKWPGVILFYCHTAAEEGGETPILDCRLLLKELNKDIVDSFERYGVRYTRYLSGAKGVGKSWMDTFETTERTVVEKYCLENKIEFSWEGDCLLLIQTGVGIARHPRTREKVWFNQANQFHPSNLPEDIFKMLKIMHASNRHRFPQYAFFGNGEEIPESHLKEITEIQFDSAMKFPWQAGDILMLDNMLMAHGRMPFKGERKIYVSMY
jgi:alpha-ketoglutarate-dependent taurine dioxygenase